MSTASTEKTPRRRARLDPAKARMVDVARMPDAILWQRLKSELSLAVSAGEDWEGRTAFYAAVRAQAIAVELHLRGSQLQLPFLD